MTNPLHLRSVTELLAGLDAREFTSRQLVDSYLARISNYNHWVNGFVSLRAEAALDEADEIDEARASGQPLGRLAGIPIAVKDSIPTAGIPTTCNSRVLEHNVPKEDASPIRLLREAGAIILGKSNLNEFGWALPSDSDLTPRARNPWNPDYASIGSSSGSGIVVSAGFVAAAIGTDGGGSARLPAGQHNLVGLKPTHGLVSRKNMEESWISEVSPMTRTVADTALLMSIMAGREPDDWTSPSLGGPDYTRIPEADISGWRIGVPRRLIEEAELEDEVAAAYHSTLSQLAELGAELIDIEIPGLLEARMANFVVLNGQTYTSHATSLRRHPELYGESAKVYHWMGAFLTAADLLNARNIGYCVRDILQETFRGIRAIVTPTSPVVTAEAARRPDSHRRGSNAAFTAPFNLTGHPAISIPGGFSASTGLPIGVQFVGALHDEATLLQLAGAIERQSDWRARQPFDS